MTLSRSGWPRYTPQAGSGLSQRELTPMQEQLRDAIVQLVPPKRRGQRQGWQRKEILARRQPACRLLEQIIDEAVQDGVADQDIERVGLALLDAIRQKLDARHPRPLGVQSLGAVIRDEEAVQGEMAAIQIEQITAPSRGGLEVLRYYYLRHTARIRDCLRVINAQVRGAAS